MLIVSERQLIQPVKDELVTIPFYNRTKQIHTKPIVLVTHKTTQSKEKKKAHVGVHLLKASELSKPD